MTFSELEEEIALAAWKIGAAELMITCEESERRWNSMPRQGSNKRIEWTHIVGCALIALEERGLINCDKTA